MSIGGGGAASTSTGSSHTARITQRVGASAARNVTSRNIASSMATRQNLTAAQRGEALRKSREGTYVEDRMIQMQREYDEFVDGVLRNELDEEDEPSYLWAKQEAFRAMMMVEEEEEMDPEEIYNYHFGTGAGTSTSLGNQFWISGGGGGTNHNHHSNSAAAGATQTSSTGANVGGGSGRGSDEALGGGSGGASSASSSSSSIMNNGIDHHHHRRHLHGALNGSSSSSGGGSIQQTQGQMAVPNTPESNYNGSEQLRQMEQMELLELQQEREEQLAAERQERQRQEMMLQHQHDQEQDRCHMLPQSGGTVVLSNKQVYMANRTRFLDFLARRQDGAQ